MDAQANKHATAAAHLSLDRVRNRWVNAHEMGAKLNPRECEAEAKGIFDLWCAITGATYQSPEWTEMANRVKATTATKR